MTNTIKKLKNFICWLLKQKLYLLYNNHHYRCHQYRAWPSSSNVSFTVSYIWNVIYFLPYIWKIFAWKHVYQLETVFDRKINGKAKKWTIISRKNPFSCEKKQTILPDNAHLLCKIISGTTSQNVSNTFSWDTLFQTSATTFTVLLHMQHRLLISL